MLSTIDLDALNALYCRQLIKYLPISFVEVIAKGRGYRYAVGNKKAASCVTLGMAKLGEEVQDIVYGVKRPLAESELALLQLLHNMFAQPLSNAFKFERMKQMATKDPLTGLGNRNGFNESYERIISQSLRHCRSFGLLIIDLDNFKSVNDSFGHQEGDRVLTEVATLINKALRNGDQAFRFGGDEFCCILDCVESDALTQVASRLKESICESTFLQSRDISCSIGGAAFDRSDTGESLFGRADHALYEVKHNGKNSYKAA